MIEKDVPNAVLTQKANISDNIISKIKKWSVYGIGKACEYLRGYGLYDQRYFGAFDG